MALLEIAEDMPHHKPIAAAKKAATGSVISI
jgi:hypothetical protein